MKTNIIIQAREGSTRFPLKVLQKINNKTILQILYERLTFSKKTNKIIFSIPKKNNDNLIRHLKELKYEYFLGDEKDVLSRYYNTSTKFPSDIIVRITADCPLVDPKMLDEMIDLFISSKSDYTSNTLPPTFPDGLDIEIFNFKSLKKSYDEANTDFDREHVTSYIRNNNFFKKTNFKSDIDYSKFRITLDEKEDLIVISNILNYYNNKELFLWKDIKNLIQKKSKLFMANLKTKRNEGAKLGTGQKLWKRAKNIIPGGNMLLSKRPEMFLPENWPSYFSKAKGCKVWDMDNKQYFDMSMMGIGTNTLGYGHPDVDKAVMEVVNKGNMSTLNCPEEVFLAEKLIELHPWSEMVRLARTGAEANSIAIRIARAASNKDNVAVCGYHGWHDWYLSANIGNNNSLNDHLFPGLSSAGVPKALKDTVFTFEYNNFKQLQKLVDEKNIGTIKMEVTRNFLPKDNFLLKVRELASKKNIVLIFDECSSGFRQTYGGIHKIFNVEPDLAMFGKTLGNGYAITAVIGKRSIMEHAQNTFISSTFWTERIGPTAALKTLEIMKNVKSWEKITEIGLKIKNGWLKLSKKYNLKITTSGIPAFINFKIESKNWLKYKTYLTQEMLKKGFLASNSVYACTEHKDEVIEQYFQNLDPIFKKISEFEEGEEVEKYLEGPISHPGFKRLN